MTKQLKDKISELIRDTSLNIYDEEVFVIGLREQLREMYSKLCDGECDFMLKIKKLEKKVDAIEGELKQGEIKND